MSLLVLALGCGDDEGSVGVGDGRDRGLPFGDSGTEAGVAQDGGGSGGSDGWSGDGGPPGATMDAAALGLDAALMLPSGSWILEDGGILLPDGRVIDVDTALMEYGPEPDVTRCQISEDDAWSTPIEIESEGGFSLVPGPTGFGLVYRGTGNDTCAQTINAMHIPSSEGFPEPHSLPMDGCPAITDLGLAAVAGQWRLAWVDNSTLSAELHTAQLDAAMTLAPEQRRTLTDNQGQLEMRPVLAEVAGRPLLAWLTRSGDKRRITAQWLDGDAEPVDLVDEDDGHLPQGLALSAIGHERAAVAWVGTVDNPGAFYLPLDETGMPASDPIKLTTRVSASSSIDLAWHPEGGAAVYSIQIDGISQIRFRRFDANGMPIGEERVVVSSPLQGQDASIFGVAGGYAIAYRAMPGGSVTSPQIRLTFVSKEGMPMRDPTGGLITLRIADTTFATMRTRITVSVEGQIMVGWVEADTASDSNLLKIVRRRLDCD